MLQKFSSLHGFFYYNSFDYICITSISFIILLCCILMHFSLFLAIAREHAAVIILEVIQIFVVEWLLV